jgi:hypothetical protein
MVLGHGLALPMRHDCTYAPLSVKVNSGRLDKRSAPLLCRLTWQRVGETVARVDWINAAFDLWYWILIAILVVMVPVWFGRFLYEATATVRHRRRTANDRAEPRAPAERRD